MGCDVGPLLTLCREFGNAQAPPGGSKPTRSLTGELGLALGEITLFNFSDGETR
jgi:hypothetical protein